jgi:hypothetical protein
MGTVAGICDQGNAIWYIKEKAISWTTEYLIL